MTRNTLHATVLFGFASFACMLRADTVALWKLDYEVNGTVLNTRCLLKPAHDLSLFGGVWAAAAVNQWNALPPNPDATDGFLASPTNQYSVGFSTGANALTNHAMSARVDITSSFTIEGWINRAGNPSGSGGWHYLVGNHAAGAGRWILSLRNGGTNWMMYVDGHGGDQAFPVKNDPGSTNVWQHIALTYDRDAGSAQQGVWELFIDAQSYGAITNTSRPATLAPSDSLFMLGGRTSSGQTGNWRLDYWRVSDTVLAPADFLNAPSDPTPSAPETLPRTVAYWRFDTLADGTLDTRDFVGNAHLSSGLDITNHTTIIKASRRQAFDGQPPNSALPLPNGNTGSVYAQGAGANLQVPELGTYLETTNSFTVEGWICPQRRDHSPDIQYIANTRLYSKGWAFALKRVNGLFRFVIYAQDDAGVQVSDTSLSENVDDWSDTWRHVALVYDHTAGNQARGVWSCYLDGVLQRAATNAHDRSGTTSSEYFHLAGRVLDNSSFCGGLDCWRVSQAALAPSQFLNATENPAPATDVLALWPLNSADGLYIDATDVTGAWSFNTPLTAQYKVTGSALQAADTIPNPDTSAGFRGDPTASTGSIVFRTSSSAASSFLASTDTATCNMLCLTNSFTWEGWLYRTQEPSNWYLLFGSSAAPNFASGGMQINFTYRPTGFVMYARGTALVNDKVFNGTAGIIPLNIWHHVALVYDVSIGNGTWLLYVDGVYKDAIENATAPANVVPGAIYLGGRPWTANSFAGAMDSVRLTKGALEPSQFLNATDAPPPAPEPTPRTLAYWKLDNTGGALDASSQVEPRYSFVPDVYAPGASIVQFRRVVAMPDTSPDFIGDPVANAGSAAFDSANYLRVQNLGYQVETDRAFTIEGWMFLNALSPGTTQTIAGTRFNTTYGWRLALDTHGGTPAFRLFNRTSQQTPLADDLFPFDASGLVGGWHHLALSFTPCRNDTGTWELFVNGVSAGTVTQRFYTTAQGQSHWFVLGGQAFGADALNGLLDCWRVLEGALTPDQFLYLKIPGGTILYLR